MLTIEDLLETLASYRHKDISKDFFVERSDYSLIQSLARQTIKGIALTDRQLDLVKKKLIEYKHQFQKNGFDNIEEAFDKLRMPLRTIDRSKYIKIVDTSEVYQNQNYDDAQENWKWIKIRFPFSKKLILALEKIPKIDYHHNKGSHEHCFKLTEKTVYAAVHHFKNKNFEIDDKLLDIHDELEHILENKHLYVPGIYNMEIKNFSNTTVNHLMNTIGEPNIDNLYLYKDKKDLYGIHYFDNNDIDKSLQSKSILTQKIVKRTSNYLLINPDAFTIDQIIFSIEELDRYPILVILQEHDALDNLTKFHQGFDNLVEREKTTVLFRLDNDTNKSFNEYIKNNNLNNKVDKNTKVVYISNNKVPKPLVKENIKFKAVLFAGSVRPNTTLANYIDNIDISIHYDTDTTPFLRTSVCKLVN